MLRLFLLTAPPVSHVPAVVENLQATPPDEVHAPASMMGVASALGGAFRVITAMEPALDDPDDAVAFTEAIAARSEGTALVLASPAVASRLVHHALEAPVLPERLAFDTGGLAEIEVRLDAPWTVNRLNDRCEGDTPGWTRP